MCNFSNSEYSLDVYSLDEQLDYVWAVKIFMPYGFTQKMGEVVLSPKGEILAWRYTDAEWCKEVHTYYGFTNKISIALRDCSDDTYLVERNPYNIMGKWEVYYMQNGIDQPEIVQSFHSLADAVAFTKKDHWDTAVKVEKG
jgi:hypothetical protein